MREPATWKEAQRAMRRSLIEGRAAPAAPERRISVVVVAWNAEDVIDRCLRSLRAQEYGDFEVIVVDDASDDNTLAIASEHLVDARVSVVRSEHNNGCSAARNLGLERASGEIVAFIDADGFAHPGWLRGHARTFEDPTVGAAASVIFYDSDPLILNGTGGQANLQWWGADVNYRVPFPLAAMPHEILFPGGCGMAIRGEAIEAVGRFDERIFNYYDDLDYGVRIWRAGWRIVVSEGAHVDHGVGHSVGPSPRKEQLCERHRMRVALKHTPLRQLPAWLAAEARALRRAPSPKSEIKREAAAWNARSLPDILRARARLRGRPAPRRALFLPNRDDSHHEGPVVHRAPDLARAGDRIDFGQPDAAEPLIYGWHSPETRLDYRYCWTSGAAGALLRLDEPAAGLRIQYRQPDWAERPAEIALHSLASPGWSRRFSLPLEPAHWRTEQLQVPLDDGAYAVLIDSPDARSNPPADDRTIGVAVRSIEPA